MPDFFFPPIGGSSSSSGGDLTAQYVLTAADAALPNSRQLTAGPGVSITLSAGVVTVSASGAGTGTVTSVGLITPAEFTVSGSPITSGGNITVTKANQNANLIYAGPTGGAAGQPTFRSVVSQDLLGALAAGANINLYQAGNILTISASGAQASSVALSALAALAPSGFISAVATNLYAARVMTGTANRITVANGDGVGGNPTFDVGSNVYVAGGTKVAKLDGGLAIDTTPSAQGSIPISTAANGWAIAKPTAGAGVQITYGDGTLQFAASGAQGGTVTSVGLALPSIITVSGSPVTGTGTLTGTLANQASGLVFVGPTSGAATGPTFRGLVSSDIFNALNQAVIPGNNVTVTPNAANNTLTISAAGSSNMNGTVISVGLALPVSVFTTTGSPVTNNGTLTGTLASQASGTAFMGPVSGANAAPTFRPIQSTDLSCLVASSGILITQIGSSLIISNTSTGGGGGSGSVTSVGLTVPSFLSVSGSPITSTGTLAVTLAAEASGSFFGGPITGAAATPTFRGIVGQDLQNTLVPGANSTISLVGNTLVFASTASGGGGGSVTQVTSGNLSPLFTAAVATNTTTPAISYTAVNQASGIVYAGPQTGAAAAPLFRALASSDVYAANVQGLIPGTNITLTPNATNSTITIATTAGSSNTNGTVTSASAGNLSPLFNSTVGTPTTTPAFSFTLQNASSGTFLAGPASGAAAPWAARTITGLDLPIVQGTGIGLVQSGNNLIISNTSPEVNQNLFQKIRVQGWTDITAQTPTDILSINGSGGIFIGTNATNDILTISGSGLQPTSATLNALSSYNTNGLITQTAANTFTGRSITGTAGNIAVTNPDGVAGNPNINVGANVYTTSTSSVLNALASGLSGTGIVAQNGTVFVDRTLTGTANRIVITNGDGSSGNPTFDVGANVYTTSTSSTLNALASGLSGTGIVVQTGPGSFVDRSIVNSATPVLTLTNPDGTAGNPTWTLTNQSSGLVFVGPTSGVATAPTFRGLVSSDIYSALVQGLLPGSNVTLTPNATNSTLTITAAGSSNTNGTVTNISVGNLAPLFSSVVGTATTTPSVTYTATNQASGLFYGGPQVGAVGAPLFRAIASSDVYAALTQALVPGSNITLTPNALNSTITVTSTASGGGGGTVTSFSAGNLSSWFTTTVNTSTSTPALVFNPTGNKGDIAYYSAANTAANLAIGNATQVVGVSSAGLPVYLNTLQGLASATVSTTLSANSKSYQSIDASAAPVVLTVGAASSMPEKIFWFKNTTVTGTNTATVTFSNGTELEGTLSSVTIPKLQTWGIISDGVSVWRYLKPRVESPSSGGTGSSVSPTDGQVLIGSSAAGTYTPSSLTPGTNITITPGPNSITISAAGSGTVTSVGLSVPGLLYSTSGSPVTSTGTLTLTLVNQASGTGIFGPVSGANAAPTWRNVASGDFGPNLLDYTHGGTGTSATPTAGQLHIGNGAGFTLATLTASTGITITNQNGSITITNTSTGSAGGSGTVTTVGVGNLAPLFTTNVTNPTTTPSAAFTLTNQVSGTFFSGPVSGANAAPTFRVVSGSDLASGIIAGTNITLAQVNSGPLGGQLQISAAGISAKTWSTITGTTTGSAGYFGYVADVSSGSFNFFFPATATAGNQIWIKLKAVGSPANTLTIVPYTTIDGSGTSLTSNRVNDAWLFEFDGSNWYQFL